MAQGLRWLFNPGSPFYTRPRLDGDGLPYTGRLPGYRNLSACCGHSHVGVGLAPATGETMAGITGGGRPGLDPAPLRADRFAGRS